MRTLLTFALAALLFAGSALAQEASTSNARPATESLPSLQQPALRFHGIDWLTPRAGVEKRLAELGYTLLRQTPDGSLWYSGTLFEAEAHLICRFTDGQLTTVAVRFPGAVDLDEPEDNVRVGRVLAGVTRLLGSSDEVASSDRDLVLYRKADGNVAVKMSIMSGSKELALFYIYRAPMRSGA